MNISAYFSSGNVIMHCDHINGISFNNAFAGVDSALLPVICAFAGHKQDNCAHFSELDASRRTCI